MDMTAKQERRQRELVNSDLQALGNYHDGLALTEIDAILTKHGFNAMEPAIYCGREGRANDQVGQRTFVTMTWFKMESGRYEVVAYAHQ